MASSEDHAPDALPEARAAVLDQHRMRLNRARAASNQLKVSSVGSQSIDWAEVIAPMARDLLDAFEQLINDELFWREVQADAVDQAAEESVRLKVEELIYSDLTGVLDLLGYSEPPPPASAELAADVSVAFQALQSQPTALRAELILETRRRLILYVWHLRRLIREWNDSDLADPAAGWRLWHALQRGAAAAAPGVVAAGVVALMDPPTGAATVGAAFVHGLDEATKVAVGSAIKGSATAAISMALASEDDRSQLGEKMRSDINQFRFVCRALDRSLDQDLPAVVGEEAGIRAMSIYVTRLAYRILQSSAVVNDRLINEIITPIVDQAVRNLNVLQGWLDLPYEPVWSEVSTSVRRSLDDSSAQLKLFSNKYIGP